MAKESDFIDWLRRRMPAPDPSVLMGCGPDDCAWIRPGGPLLAVATDTLLEGTHFLPDADPRAVGWKALAVNLSDLAASGCRPRWAALALGLRRGAAAGWAEQFVEGLLECARRYGVDLVGGDTVSGDGPASITVTALGEPFPGGPLPRGGARPGDRLIVSGTLGGSMLGRHLHPEPRVAEIELLLGIALELASERRHADDADSGESGESGHPLHAAMDISDGLELDAGRMMRESGTGATLLVDAVPCSAAARTLAASGPAGGEAGPAARAAMIRHAIGDGEDFELLLSAAPWAYRELLRRFRERCPSGVPLADIGRVDAAPGLRWLDARGVPVEPAGGGYEHGW